MPPLVTVFGDAQGSFLLLAQLLLQYLHGIIVSLLIPVLVVVVLIWLGSTVSEFYISVCIVFTFICWDVRFVIYTLSGK